MPLTETHYKGLLKRKSQEAQLFERKFLDYRNKMKELYHEAEADNPLRESIRTFLEEAQGDVQFGEISKNESVAKEGTHENLS